jgi:hypothetical protein
MKSKTGGVAPVAQKYASSDVMQLALFAGILIAAATVIALIALGHGARSLTVFDISDLQGLEVKNWVTGHGFGFDGALFTGSDNSIWMRCARMPLPIWTIAGLRIVFGSGMIAVNVAKAILWSLPLIVSFALIQRDSLMCRALSSRAKWAAWGALLFVSLLPVVLVNLATMTAEEGYIASPIALATTMLIFPRSWAPGARNGRAIVRGLLFGILIAGIYLSKSSMLLLALIMLPALLMVSRNLRLTVFAAIPLVLAILCWGAWTAADGGGFSLGTSLDGYNLHKGNNPTFLEHYPPPPNMNIDPFYADIGVGHHYTSEWDFDAEQKREAVQYMKTHPRETMVAMGRKIGVLLFSLKKVGPGAVRSPMVEWTEQASRVIAQLVLWTAIFMAVWQCVRWKPSSPAAAVFLLVIAAACLPYVVGFALSRHSSILYLPAIIYILRSAYAERREGEEAPRGSNWPDRFAASDAARSSRRCSGRDQSAFRPHPTSKRKTAHGALG